MISSITIFEEACFKVWIISLWRFYRRKCWDIARERPDDEARLLPHGKDGHRKKKSLVKITVRPSSVTWPSPRLNTGLRPWFTRDGTPIQSLPIPMHPIPHGMRLMHVPQGFQTSHELSSVTLNCQTTINVMNSHSQFSEMSTISHMSCLFRCACISSTYPSQSVHL